MHAGDQFSQLQIAAIDAHFALMIAEHQLADQQAKVANLLWCERYMAQRCVGIYKDLLIADAYAADLHFSYVSMLRYDAAQCIC